MSKGKWGQFADDGDSIFIDVPMPSVVLYVVTMAASAGGCFFAARHFGASVPLALLFGFIGYALCTAIGVVATQRRMKRFEVGVRDFDAIRSAGTRALEEFRRAHPEFPEVAWSLVARRDGAHVIRVIGQRDMFDEVTLTYAVAWAPASIAVVANDAYPGTGYSQRHGRPRAE